MNLDIGHILDDWPYEHGQISARKIVGEDGKEKIQLRLELGLLQMEVTGHPAGLRPYGHESLLDYYEHLLQRYVQENGSDEQFLLDEDACEQLRNEGVLYYHRYLAEFILEDYRPVVRDASRNLRLMDFCNCYATRESDRQAMEQYRPYVVMMRTRASALLALRDNRPKAALDTVRKGIREIRQCHERLEDPTAASTAGELAILRSLAREIGARIPPDPIKVMKRQLALAVREERYEDAAGLRDKLRALSGQERVGKRAVGRSHPGK